MVPNSLRNLRQPNLHGSIGGIQDLFLQWYFFVWRLLIRCPQLLRPQWETPWQEARRINAWQGGSFERKEYSDGNFICAEELLFSFSAPKSWFGRKTTQFILCDLRRLTNGISYGRPKRGVLNESVSSFVVFAAFLVGFRCFRGLGSHLYRKNENSIRWTDNAVIPSIVHQIKASNVRSVPIL